MNSTSPDDSTPPAGLDKRDWIAGLERGVSIIEAFDDANPRLTASQAGGRRRVVGAGAVHGRKCARVRHGGGARMAK